jgi:hypothetical protein
MELVATLLIDIPLQEQSFRGVLMDISQSSLAGAISQHELVATHSFGEADFDTDVRDIRVLANSANTAPPEVKRELETIGFGIRTVIRFETYGDQNSREDAWALAELYADQLKGWVLTSYLDFKTAAERLGSGDGLMHLPAAGKRKMVLIASNKLKGLR